jgi:formylmethanofuran dehydrogenase subunit C
MPLRLTLRQTSNIPLEVEGITPDTVRGQSLAEIEKLEIFHGNAKTPLAEFFSVAGNAADEVHDWEGDLAGVHWIGAKMRAGRIVVQGNAGRHVGSELRGGEIHVLGDAGDWAGAELHGGLIRIRGRAGDNVGSAYRGSAKGMTGGTILVEGDAGSEAGRLMRRGLIAIGGSVGDLAGVNLLAGSILIFGESGVRPAAGMKRGTLALLGKMAPPLLPSFRRACRYRAEHLQLIFRQLKQLEFPVADELLSCAYDLYNGDLVEGGRGEILLPAR